MKLGALSVGFFVVGLALVGCGGSSKPTTPQCSLPSDCAKLSTPGLVCALGYCVKPCNVSSDCPIVGQRCIVLTAAGDGGTSTADAGVAQGTACQAPELAMCNYNSMCSPPLVCSSDRQCRDMCETNADCPGMGMGAGAQVCTSTTHLCADPAVDKDYNATINDFVVNDAGMGIPQGGNSGTGGTGTGGNGTGNGGSGGHGGTGTGGAAGTSVNACQSPQTSFGNIAQGDPNPAFTSGVGVRDGNQLFVFSAYVTPASDGGVDAGNSPGNYIYVQAFDSTSGNSKGAASPLLKTADGPYFGVYDVSVAPTGEIVVLHSRAAPGTGPQSQLYATFLSSPSASDGGVGGVDGLKVVKTVQLESVSLGEPRVVWSVANAAFIMSWKYLTTAWFMRVRRFLPDGRSAGGDTSVVPTRSGSNNDSNTNDCQVGTSGNLIGAAYRDDTNAIPYLTILDSDGLQVGDILQIGAQGSSWVSTGGTSNGFVVLFNINGSTVNGAFVPTSGSGGVLRDGGTTVDAGDGGVGSLFTYFSMTSTGSSAKMVSDDTGGFGGVGAVLLDATGASFLYVTANGSKRLASGSVISSAHGAEIGLSNYKGSFAVSLYDGTTHATQVVASGCSP